MNNHNLFKSFKLLLGNGRAFNLQGLNIQNISKSFLKAFEDLIRVFHRIELTTFPSQNTYLTDEEKIQDINNLENQFDINPSDKTTIEEKAKNIEAQFGIVGGQSWKYLQNSIQNIGINIRVVENIPTKDLLSENIMQYGLKQYDAKDINGTQYAMYGKSGYLVIGNGTLQIKEFNEETNSYIITNKDPITIINNLNLFVIEDINGGPVKITSGQLNLLTDLILRIKPLQQVALLNMTLI